MPSRPAIDALATELAFALGRRLTLDPTTLARYQRDESPYGPYLPELAARPRCASEVAHCVTAAAHHGVPIVARGAGTGRVGGALAVNGGLLIDLSAMTAPTYFNPSDLCVTVEAGMITQNLQSLVEERGLFYPVDPSSLESCTIGGNVATNAAGARTVKYGVTGHYVLGMTVVLPSGELVALERSTHKRVAGYDLAQLFVGSEGTLGVICEVTLRLIPRPPSVHTGWATFPDLPILLAAVEAVLASGLRPRALEAMDAPTRQVLCRRHPALSALFVGTSCATLLFETDGLGAAPEEELYQVGQVCLDHGAGEVLVSRSSAQAQAFWQARRLVSSSLRETHAHVFADDVCVPLSRIADLAAEVECIAARHHLPTASYGHCGDGNLHVNFIAERPEDIPAAGTARAELHRAVWARQGTISAEHGIGLGRREALATELGPRRLAMQRAIKGLFDPQGIMNPGKVFPG